MKTHLWKLGVFMWVTAPLSVWAEQAPTSTSIPDENMGWLLLRTIVVLGIVVALVYLSLNFGLRKLAGLKGLPSQRVRAVQVIQRIPLDQKKTLFLVKVADEYLLLGGGDDSVTLLSTLNREKLDSILKDDSQSSVSLSPFLKKLLSKDGGMPPPTA